MHDDKGLAQYYKPTSPHKLILPTFHCTNIYFSVWSHYSTMYYLRLLDSEVGCRVLQHSCII